MEIGNLIFGHSRGKFVLDRKLEDSPSWYKLLEATESDKYGITSCKENANDVCGFENDVFAIRPYWWGDSDAEEANMPNFLYKQNGFEIRWYKYPFRDSYINMDLEISEIEEIFQLCLDSISGHDKYKVDLHPQKCNLCGGKVIYTSNSVIYHREYGSGKIYLCTNCGAYVGTHENNPKEAHGILADENMRKMKIKCHDLFDMKWLHSRNKKVARAKAYKWLANELNIPLEYCHFGYFDMDMLNKAYSVLSKNINVEF